MESCLENYDHPGSLCLVEDLIALGEVGSQGCWILDNK